MKYVLGAAEIRAAEDSAKSNGVDELFLRLNASLAVADVVSEWVKKRPDTKIAVLCGSGGNGCDGLLAACRLYRENFAVTAYTVGDPQNIDSSVMAYAKNEGLPIKSSDEFDGAGVIVDAIFGIGLNRPIEGKTAELIERVNAHGDATTVLAVDIPSGLNADSGEIMGACIQADMTLSFTCYKTGMLFAHGRDVCGKIVIKDVGVKHSSNVCVYEDIDFPVYARKKSAHKGTAGRVFIIGGCGTMVGAPIMAGAAAHAAYLNGAGTVTVCVPKVHRTAMAARTTMAMLKFMSDTDDGFIRFDKAALDDIIGKASAIDIGIGMGATPDLKRILDYICANFGGTLVIDADALNAIKGDYDFLSGSKAKIVVTPHVGEFERLTGKKATIENAALLAENTGAVVVLKSATTVITDGKQIRINLTGTPAMAKGGMGDVLGGCITALSCAFDPIDAATVACYRNGIGAERAVSSYAEMMLTSDEVLKYADYNE